MKPFARLFVVFSLVTFMGPERLLAWLRDGHEITSEIAERNSDPPVRTKVRAILGEKSLAELST